jgi:hypothetical protein
MSSSIFYPANCPICGARSSAFFYEPEGWHMMNHESPGGDDCCADFSSRSKMPPPDKYVPITLELCVARLEKLERELMEGGGD